MDNSNKILGNHIQETIDKMLEKDKEFMQNKIESYQSDVLDNPQYKRVLKYCTVLEMILFLHFV